MKIAIVLAICVIFSSVIYTTEAQAEVDGWDNTYSGMVATFQIGVSSFQVYPMIGTVSVSEPILADVVFAQYSRENDFTNIDVKGKIVLAQRGGETASESVFFTDKEIFAAKNGAVGLIIYNNVSDVFFGDLTISNSDKYTPLIPVVTMSQEDGIKLQKIIELYQAARFNVSPDPALIKTPESIPELIFDGGDFKIHQGSDLPVEIKIKIANHNNKIIPLIHTIYDNKIVNTQIMKASHTGNYLTFLNIDQNYASGEYYLQLQYDEKKSNPIPFKVIKEYDEKKETIAGKGDYTKKLFDEKQSYIELSQEHFDIEFSTKNSLVISGDFDNRGKKGIAEIIIQGPKTMKLSIILPETGHFETFIEIDKEWPSGTYKVIERFQGKQFATNEFTIKNFNKDSLIKDIPISGSVSLDVLKSNQYSILLINGKLEGQSFPEQVGIEISQNADVIDFSYSDVMSSGEFETSLVLYDYIKKSNWDEGTYDVKITNSATLEPYNISSIFKITNQGTVISDLEQGMKILTETGLKFLEVEEAISIERYYPKEINVFGIVNDYLSGIPIEISVITNGAEVKKFDVRATKDGQYMAPILINEEWNSGQYDVFVNYNGEIKNALSFNLAEKSKVETEDVSEVASEDEPEEKSKDIERFEIIQNDLTTNEFVNIKFSTTSDVKRFERHPITLERPDGTSETFEVKTDTEGRFTVPVIIENSWMEGIYKLSSVENQQITQFGEFSIIKQISEPEPFVLADILETANPEKIYQTSDKILLEKNQIIILRGHNTHLDASGQVSNYEYGNIEMQIHKGDNIISKHKIKPASNGMFKTTTILDDSIGYGYYEISATYNDKKFATSEFLIVEPKTIPVNFETKSIQISRDMFVESGGEITVKISEWIDDYKRGDSNYVIFTILNADGTMETFETKSMKGGYFTYRIPVTSEWQKGTYIITAEFKGEKLGHIYLQITDFDFKWVKNYTEQWVNGDISSNQYVNRINTTIENNGFDSDITISKVIPEWVKITAKSWIDGTISQKEFVQVIKFLQ